MKSRPGIKRSLSGRGKEEREGTEEGGGERERGQKERERRLYYEISLYKQLPYFGSSV